MSYKRYQINIVKFIFNKRYKPKIVRIVELDKLLNDFLKKHIFYIIFIYIYLKFEYNK